MFERGSMNSANGEPRVSTFSRVLAWVFVVCTGLGLGNALLRLWLHKTWLLSFEATALLVVGLSVFLPLFLFVAMKGRSPRWLSSAENLYGAHVDRREINGADAKVLRWLPFAAASITFGVFLFFFGYMVEAFSGEGFWFAAGVFVLIWAAVTFLLWRYFGRWSDRSQRKG